MDDIAASRSSQRRPKVNLFTVFAPLFLEWPIQIAARFHQVEPEFRVSGIATGQKAIHQRAVMALAGIEHSIDWLDPLEREWASTPDHSSILDDHVRRLGDHAVKRILLSDRYLAAGFVTGGTAPSAWLADQSRGHNLDFHRRYLAGLLTYCFERLENERPSMVFVYALADAPRVALSEVAHHLGIPFYSLTPARIANGFVLDDSPNSMQAPVRRAFRDRDGLEAQSEDELESARELLHSFRSEPSPPAYLAVAVRQSGAPSLVRQVVRSGRAIAADVVRRHSHSRNSWVRNAVADLRANLAAKRAMRSGVFSDEVPAGRYAYYPLHVDPEASTMVLTPMVTNQLAVIETLAKALPVDMNLVVKEHIPMMGRRPPGFYETLSGMPGVALVSPFSDQYELIRGAALTCTITGTAGLEAIILGRPVVLFGDAPYSVLNQGFVKATSWLDLPQRVAEALDIAPVDEERLERYVACLLGESLPVPSAMIWQDRTQRIPVKGSKELDALCDALRARLDLLLSEPRSSPPQAPFPS
jgi:hypothetical protein